MAIIAAALLLSVAAFAQDAKKIYNRYSDRENVSAVYISPSMFKLIGNVPNISMGKGEMDISPIIRDLKGMYLISTEDTALAKQIMADAEELFKSGKYELMVEAKDGGDAVKICSIMEGDFIVSLLVIAAESDGESCFISLDGKIAKSDLEKLIASAM